VERGDPGAACRTAFSSLLCGRRGPLEPIDEDAGAGNEGDLHLEPAATFEQKFPDIEVRFPSPEDEDYEFLPERAG
jgi:hypothetical protein